MDPLLKYFMEETNKRLDTVDDKLTDLTKFKVEMIASARLTSFIVSGLCGLITMIATMWMSYKTH